MSIDRRRVEVLDEGDDDLETGAESLILRKATLPKGRQATPVGFGILGGRLQLHDHVGQPVWRESHRTGATFVAGMTGQHLGDVAVSCDVDHLKIGVENLGAVTLHREGGRADAEGGGWGG